MRDARVLGFSVEETKKPQIVQFQQHDSLSADVSATKRTGIPIKVQLNFRYSDGTSVDSPATLYSIHVFAVDATVPPQPIASPSDQKRAAQAAIQDMTNRLRRDKDKELTGLQFVGGDLSSVAKKQVINSDRVGRNDPCPCGSGKKYKHCHGGA